MNNIIYKYLVYVAYFLGIGMTSSGIVLMPFNPYRYGIILCIGLGLFIASSLFNEVVIDKHNLSALQSMKLIILSLTLAIGIGMISGGISHFKENPTYVAFLIPCGILISFLSYIYKNNITFAKGQRISAIILIMIISVFVFITLALAASLMTDMPMGGDIFKGSH